MGDENVQYLIPGPIVPWFLPFLAAYGISTNSCVALGVEDKVHVERLFIPSLMRVNAYLPDWPFATSFARLRSYGEDLAKDVPGNPDQSRKRLWVKRTVTGPDRPDLDETGLAELMTELGFVSIAPGSQSISEQAAAFGAAEISIGEDSSSLHNIVWGKPKYVIVLSSRERLSLLHLSMCKVLQASCHYLVSAARDDGTFVIASGSIRNLLLQLGYS